MKEIIREWLEFEMSFWYNYAEYCSDMIDERVKGFLISISDILFYYFVLHKSKCHKDVLMIYIINVIIIWHKSVVNWLWCLLFCFG